MTIRLLCSCLLMTASVNLASAQQQAQAPKPQAQAPKPQDIQLRGDRFTPLKWDQLNAGQRALIEATLSAPLPTVAGPYNAMLRSPEMGLLAHNWGGYMRFRSSVPTKLNELAIMMAARFWKSEFVWFAHKRAAVNAGLSAETAAAIAAGRRPASMQPDEEAVYNFSDELLTTRQASDAAFNALKGHVGEQGVVDIVAAMAYFQFASMLANVDRYPLPDGVKPELQ